MATCIVDSWLDAHQGQIPTELWERRRHDWTPDVSAAGWRRLLGEIATNRSHPSSVFVAESVDGEVAGLVMSTVNRPGPGVIDALYVRPDDQRSGIGRRILRSALDRLVAAGCGQVEVSVLAGNEPARRFYQRQGGIERGRGTFDENGTALATVVYRWSIPPSSD